MIDRSNPMGDDVVVGGDCSDEDFVRQAMQLAAGYGSGGMGMPPNANGMCPPGAMGITGRLTTVGSPEVTALGAGATATVTIEATKGTIVACRLILDAQDSGNIDVDDVKVGGISIFPTSEKIFGNAFSSANQRGGHLPFLPAPVSQKILVSITNTSAAALTTRVGLAAILL